MFSNMLSNKISETHCACARILSYSNLRTCDWFIVRQTFPTFRLSSPSFSTMLWTWLGLPHPSITNIPQYMCTHPINATNVHLLCYTHGNEHMGTHDAVHNTFAAIAWNINFHVGQKQLHTLPSTTFHSSHQWIDIVVTKNGIHILVNVVIVDPTWVNLFRWSYATWRLVAFKVAHAKKRSYCNRHPIGHFFHLTIEVFGCLDKQVDVFLHDCANVMWNFKEPRGLPFFVLVFFPFENFNYITKNTSILHLKSSNNGSSNYFSTSTPSKHTLHQHNQPPTNDRLLRYKDFGIYFVLTSCPKN
jgi:hypothetical protein